MGESGSIPAQVVVAKRNKEKLASIGVTEERVFLTLKKALSAYKGAPREKAEDSVTEEGTPRKRAPKRIPDWNTRLRAIELYVTLTCISPEDVSKSLKGVTIDMGSPQVELEDYLPSTGVIDAMRAQGRSAIEIARALANGEEPSLSPPEDSTLVIPPKTRIGVKELLERRKEEIAQRGNPGVAMKFTPSAPLRPEDV